MKENKKVAEQEAAQDTPECASETKQQEAQPSVEELAQTVEALRAEIAEKDDRYLRMAAEYDNYRRRSRDEKLAAYDGALADTVSSLLPILDNLERAAMYEDGEQIKDGLRMIEKSVADALGSLGVSAYGERGEGFDPNLHNAVMHVEDETLGENEIAEVFQRGYKKGDKIIRFAMVKTAN